MVQLYVLVFASRLVSILFYDSYLPIDSSGDLLYRTMELSSFFLCLIILIVGYTIFKETYDSTSDSFGNFLFLPSAIGILWIIIPAFCLALVFHPSLNSNLITDVLWTFAITLESAAILPQITMLIKSLKASGDRVSTVIQPCISHILSSLGLSRLFLLVFWLASYTELNDKFTLNAKITLSPVGVNVGNFVVLSQCVQLLIMCDFLYYYVKALYSGHDIIEHLQNNWAMPPV
tara:strand:- start:3660 stop:4358 length:699 start_codon:yes stop_codon:yes gene_type:complete